MGIFGTLMSGMFGLAQARIAAGAQTDVGMMNWDASKKQNAAANMRNAVVEEGKATQNVNEQGYRSSVLKQQAFGNLMDVLRSTYLRQSGLQQ